jgi:hypothetical protein
LQKKQNVEQESDIEEGFGHVNNAGLGMCKQDPASYAQNKLL